VTSIARSYHEATKHSFESVRRRGQFLDWSNKPQPFKVYEGQPQLSLPREIPALGVAALDAMARSGSVRQLGDLDVRGVARLLFLAAGVHRAVDAGGGGRILFRTYASAGALYPVELYLACGGIPGIDAGLYHFDPLGFSLTRLRKEDPRPALVRAAGGEPALSTARLILILTGMPWRTAWKYAERGYRHLFWDAGMILANLITTASATDLPAAVILGFDDDEVEELLGLDARREFPLCLVKLDTGDPVEPADGRPEPMDSRDRPLSHREHEFELIRRVNDSGKLEASEVAAWRSRGAEVGGPVVTTRPNWDYPKDPLDEVIRRRGSDRFFSRGAMPDRVLATTLGLDTLSIWTDYGDHLIEPYVIANAVEGLDPGAYVYRQGGLELLRAGDFRREAGYLCLEQRLAADAAAAIFLMADLDGVLDALGDRGYRAAQLEGGIVAGRIYLGAYAHRFGATGLTFYDDDVTEFFSPDAAGKSCMLVVVVGESPRLAMTARVS